MLPLRAGLFVCAISIPCAPAAAQARPAPTATIDEHVRFLVAEVQRDGLASLAKACTPSTRPGVETCTTDYSVIGPIVTDVEVQITRAGPPAARRGFIRLTLARSDETPHNLAMAAAGHGVQYLIDEALAGWTKELASNTRYVSTWSECSDRSGRTVILAANPEATGSGSVLTLTVGGVRPATCSGTRAAEPGVATDRQPT